MSTSFQGWRRKAGCVTLVLACVLAMGWIRSLTFYDGIRLRIRGQLVIYFKSTHGHWDVNVYSSNLPQFPSWITTNLDDFHKLDRNSIAFECGVCATSMFEPFTASGFPYSLFVIPLIILSTCLLMSKTRRVLKRRPIS